MKPRATSAEGDFGRGREQALKVGKKTDEETTRQNKNGAEKTAPFLRPQRLEKGFFYSLNVLHTGSNMALKACDKGPELFEL